MHLTEHTTMTNADTINASFELLGGVLTWSNVARLYKDRMVLGFDWRVAIFWTTWGLWNLFYYPHLEQWLSFAAGVVIVVANATWVAMAIYYRCVSGNIPGLPKRRLF